MKNKVYKPAIDKLFYMIWIPTTILLIFITMLAYDNLAAFIIVLCSDLFCYYFLVSSLIGYVELRKNTVFIKFGFILKKEIPYEKIRSLEKEKSYISYSMLSLKNATEHVNIKYNKFDMVTVSVKDNDDFINELNKRKDILEFL